MMKNHAVCALFSLFGFMDERVKGEKAGEEKSIEKYEKSATFSPPRFVN